jgi:cytochrome c2
MPYARRSGWGRLGWLVAYRAGAALLAPVPKAGRPDPVPQPLPAEHDEAPDETSTGTLRSLAPIAAALVIAFVVFLALYGAKRESDRTAFAAMLTGGEAAKAPELMRRYGCAGCHEIPGVRGPGGRVGPPLEHLAARVYIAGMATNTPANLIQWIVDPKSINPKTAMPVTGISPDDARHVAAYLLARR